MTTPLPAAKIFKNSAVQTRYQPQLPTGELLWEYHLLGYTSWAHDGEQPYSRPKPKLSYSLARAKFWVRREMRRRTRETKRQTRIQKHVFNPVGSTPQR